MNINKMPFQKGNQYGKYKRTEATKRKIKLANERYWRNPNARKMQSLKRKGKTYEEIFGEKKAIELKKQRSLIMKNITREKHFNWKGDKVGYFALHIWIRKNKPKPKLCEFCQKKKKLTLANIKNHIYTRNLEDYKWLCYKCHRNYDLKVENYKK